MAQSRKLVDAINNSVQNVMAQHLGYATSNLVYGIYQGSEDVDSDLSKVELISSTTDYARFVPKLANSATLNVGDIVLCVQGGSTPLTILDKVSGNITLAE